MATQTIWRGTISFSLVAIPVQMVKAVVPGRVSFRMLHRKDYSPLLRKMVCPADGKVVGPEEMIRGYEIGPEKYILVTEGELASLTPERSSTIEISEFVDLEEADAVYYDHPYYLIPAKGGEKAYHLLAEVMGRTRKAGLAKFVLGEREYFAAVKSTEGALSLIILHYDHEILSVEKLEPEEGEADAAEEIRLQKIIRGMTGDFTPEHYINERKRKIMKMIRKKGKQQAPVLAPVVEEEAEGEGPADLVALLQESMRKVKEKHP